jgi:hypothetical protein
MPRDDNRRSRGFGERGPPVALSPLRRPNRINRDHPQPSVGGHADQQVAELAGRDPRDDPPEALAAPPPAERLPANLTSIGEVEVLDDQRPAAGDRGQANNGGDRRPEVAVAAAGRQAIQLHGDGVRRADRVAARVQNPGVEVAGVQVDPQRPVAAQLLPRRRGDRRQPPRCSQVPAALGRVEGDVVADRSGGGLRRPRVPAVGEDHRAGQPIAAVRLVGKVAQQGGQLELAPALVGMHPDGLVAPPLGGLPISGQEPPLGPPAGTPLLLGELGVL